MLLDTYTLTGYMYTCIARLLEQDFLQTGHTHSRPTANSLPISQPTRSLLASESSDAA